MTDLEQFKADRNEALLSLDETKIRAYCKKYNVMLGLSMPVEARNIDVFWMAIHKAITGCLDLPIEFRRKSKAWLEERGSKSLDDGDL